MIDRRAFFATTSMALASTGFGAFADEADVGRAMDRLIFGNRAEFSDALQALRVRGGQDLTAGLIFALRFTPHFQDQIREVLVEITGQKERKDWHDWMLWQEANSQIVPHASYAELKRSLFLRIDPNFDIFLKPSYLERDRMKIRLEEIT